MRTRELFEIDPARTVNTGLLCIWTYVACCFLHNGGAKCHFPARQGCVNCCGLWRRIDASSYHPWRCRRTTGEWEHYKFRSDERRMVILGHQAIACTLYAGRCSQRDSARATRIMSPRLRANRALDSASSPPSSSRERWRRRC